jgi:hypothetical protein
MCNKGMSCRFADLGKCFYAHSFDELLIEPCSYGTSCIFICVNSAGSVINNPTKHKVCGYIHTSETNETYHARVNNHTPKEDITVTEPLPPVAIEPIKLTVTNEWTTIVKKKMSCVKHEDTRPTRVNNTPIVKQQYTDTRPTRVNNTPIVKQQYTDTRPTRVHVDDIHVTVTKLLNDKPKELSFIIEYD